MTWTGHKPTTDGWYFWRETPEHTDPQGWSVLYFSAERHAVMYKQMWISPPGGWWAGPLPLPMDGGE